MQYFNSLDKVKTDRHTVVTLGKFDGMHVGHQKLIGAVHALARENDAASVMFTFETSPQIKLGQNENKQVVTGYEKRLLAERFGLDILMECPFDDYIKNMSAEDFVEKILIEKFHAGAVVAGTDFRFGRGRVGDAAYLKENAKRFGLIVEIVEKETFNGRDISSTYVREEIKRGDIPLVNTLLGFEYFVVGEVVAGMHMGNSLGFPTINIVPQKDKLLPPNGVYSSYTEINGQVYTSISNIGVKPTVGENELGVETFILDFSGDLYGQTAAVKLLEFMRPEKKFASLHELKKQVDTDIEKRRNAI